MLIVDENEPTMENILLNENASRQLVGARTREKSEREGNEKERNLLPSFSLGTEAHVEFKRF